jgi:hypothetical protein
MSWRRLLAAGLLALAGFAAQAGGPSPIAPEHQRSVEQTFLTYPEWFLVHSPAEYAHYVAQHPTHGFPFLRHVGQLWSSYRSVTAEQLSAGYPANPGYHTMICVIAGSTTVEYGLRSAYENTVGRASWLLSSGRLTAEDQYGARAAQDYVDFIRREPWYRFDFMARLKGLWFDTPLLGTDMVRKLERRYVLSTEYLVKAAYARMIELATRSAYTPAVPTTEVVAESVPPDFTPPENVRHLRTLQDDRAVLELPRYADFRVAAARLAEMNVKLVDIAGNDSVILVTVLAGENAAPSLPPGARMLFEQPIVTEPGRSRRALVLPVRELSQFLLDAPAAGLSVEHVYDY